MGGLGVEELDLKERGKSKDLQLAYLFPFPEWSVGSQGAPAGVG